MLKQVLFKILPQNNIYLALFQRYLSTLDLSKWRFLQQSQPNKSLMFYSRIRSVRNLASRRPANQEQAKPAVHSVSLKNEPARFLFSIVNRVLSIEEILCKQMKMDLDKKVSDSWIDKRDNHLRNAFNLLILFCGKAKLSAKSISDCHHKSYHTKSVRVYTI